MPIAILDIIVVVIVLISAILAMIRGFSREVLSVGSWAVAGAAGAYVFLFDEPITPFVKSYVENDLIATITATGLAFIVTLIVVSFITMRISDFIIDSSIGALDRTIGFIFGAARGLLLLVVAMAFFNWFQPENQPSWIAEAKSKPFIDSMVVALTDILPQDIDDLISIGQERLGRGDDDASAPSTQIGGTPNSPDQDRQILEQIIQPEQN